MNAKANQRNAPKEKPQITALAAIIALKEFTRQGGVSSITGWRWRKKGWLKCINIAGKPYVTSEEIARFKARATSGEFSSPPSGAAAQGGKS